MFLCTKLIFIWLLSFYCYFNNRHHGIAQMFKLINNNTLSSVVTLIAIFLFPAGPVKHASKNKQNKKKSYEIIDLIAIIIIVIL